jgi:hypothetical protein
VVCDAIIQENLEMKKISLEQSQLRTELCRELIGKYGELVGGTDLAKVLGYRTQDAFRRAASSGVLTLKTFNVPGRHGRHAMTRDAVDWLIFHRFNEPCYEIKVLEQTP